MRGRRRIERERDRERATGERWEALAGGEWFVPGARGEGERRGGIYGAHAGVQNTLGLKLETKTPVGAKPEIFT